jgi:hypothetical protein
VVAGAPDAILALGIVEHGRIRRISKTDVLVSDVAWFPDSKHLLLAWVKFGEDGAETPQRFSIIDARGHTVRDVPYRGNLIAAEDASLTLLPDARHVLLGMRPVGQWTALGDVTEVDLESGAARAVLASPGVDETSAKYLADGRMVLRARTTDVWGQRTNRIELFNPRSNRRTVVSRASEGPSRFALLPGPPAVVVYYSTGGDGSTLGLWAVNLEGGTHRRLSEEPFHNPTADPDGRHVLVARLDNFNRSTLVRLEIIDEHGQLVSSVRSP